MSDESAYHEAGHAVAAIVLGGSLGRLTIEPERDDRFGEIEVRWPVSQFQPQELTRRTIQVALAGPAAEMVYRGDPFHPALVAEWGADWSMAWETAATLRENQRDRLRFLEHMTVELHRWIKRDDVWAAVAAVADELLAHETLDGDAVEDVVAYWLRR